MACTEKNYWHTPDPRNHPTGMRFAAGPHRGRNGTGKRGDRYYYKGIEWLGPSNAIGKPGPEGKLVLTRKDDHSFGLMPI